MGTECRKDERDVDRTRICVSWVYFCVCTRLYACFCLHLFAGGCVVRRVHSSSKCADVACYTLCITHRHLRTCSSTMQRHYPCIHTCQCRPYTQAIICVCSYPGGGFGCTLPPSFFFLVIFFCSGGAVVIQQRICRSMCVVLRCVLC